jgi:oligosaccharyltransferase complex subunit delta (ribophorin II)
MAAALRKMLCLILLGSLFLASEAITLSTYFNEADLARFKAIFLQPYNDDLSELEYSIYGLTLLKEPLPDTQKICDTVKRNVKNDDTQSLFQAIYATNSLKSSGKSCDISFGTAETKLKSVISPDSSSRDILYAVKGLSLLGLKFDSAKVAAALEAALKADDTPFSYSCAFYAASYLTGQAEIKKFHDMIEDIVAQADEIDDKYLQFDGGLVPTSTVLYTAYKLSATAKLAPTISEDKVVKFANYLLSRKHTQSKKDSVFLLSAISIWTDNKFHIPVAVSLASSVSVSSKSPVVQVRVCNLLGKSLGKLTVTADTARHIGDEAVVLSKKAFAVSSADQSLFDLDLMKVNPKRGFYRIIVSIASSQPSAKLLGASGAEVEVKVTTQVAIDNVELSVADKDQSSIPKANKLQYPKKTSMEADHHQRLVLKFSLKEEVSKQPITAHQTFVRLTNSKTKQEVIFVAEEEAGGASYKFDLDVGAKSKDFKNLSGKYTVDLIVGDAVIENPISWYLADVQLTFQDDPVASGSSLSRYAKKPEISHLFREPEKRPPTTVSNFFTVLVLVPILLLFIMWLKIGVNVSNMPISLSTLGFHGGLSAIFGLYFCYFLKLTMFQTLRYLGLIGIPTFLFGHKLLSSIAAKGWKPKER